MDRLLILSAVAVAASASALPASAPAGTDASEIQIGEVCLIRGGYTDGKYGVNSGACGFSDALKFTHDGVCVRVPHGVAFVCVWLTCICSAERKPIGY